MTPERVLHVLNAPEGGAAMSTVALARELARRGVSSSAVCAPGGSPSEREDLLAACGGRVLFTPLYWWNKKIRARTWKRPLLFARQALATGLARGSAARVAEAASRWRIQLVHTSTLLTPEGGLAARRLHLPHVWHVRELVGPGQPFRFWGETARLGRVLARGASVVVANSRATGALLEHLLSPERLVVVPNGIALGAFAAIQRPPRSRPVVGMVANVSTRWKRHALFVEAAARVRAHAEFRIYGHLPPSSDDYRAALDRAIARHGLGDRFRLMGHADPVLAMAELDLLVHPAESESFGRAVVEAMAAGLPVVGVAGGGVGEILEDGVTGLLAPPGDAAGLAERIDRLLGDPTLRAALGSRARSRAVDVYSIEGHAQRMMAVYERAMARPL